jgi:hypothetical protein
MAVLPETNPANGIIEALGPGDDFDFYSHEVNGQVPAVELGKADRIFLSGDQHVRAALLAAVHGI